MAEAPAPHRWAAGDPLAPDDCALVYKTLCLGVDVSTSVANLNGFLRDHLDLIAALKLHREDLWNALADRTRGRRAALTQAAATAA